MKEYVITVSKDMFKGDVLDLSYGDFSVLYPIFKQEEELEVEYVEKTFGKKLIEKGSFDTGVVMFTLQSINSKLGKKKLLKEISEYIKNKGYLHIWDIDKGYGKTFRGNIKVNLEKEKIESKIIPIKNFKITTDNSMDSMLRLIQEYFTIVTFKKDEEIYYIKCRKKG